MFSVSFNAIRCAEEQVFIQSTRTARQSPLLSLTGGCRRPRTPRPRRAARAPRPRCAGSCWRAWPRSRDWRRRWPARPPGGTSSSAACCTTWPRSWRPSARRPTRSRAWRPPGWGQVGLHWHAAPHPTARAAPAVSCWGAAVPCSDGRATPRLCLPWQGPAQVYSRLAPSKAGLFALPPLGCARDAQVRMVWCGARIVCSHGGSLGVPGSGSSGREHARRARLQGSR